MPDDDDSSEIEDGANAPLHDARTIPLAIAVSEERTLVEKVTPGSKEAALVDTATDVVLGAIDRVVADLCEPIREARQRGDDRAAGVAFEHAIKNGLFSLRQPEWLFEELVGIRAEALEEPLAVKLRFARIHLSHQARRLDVMEEDARVLVEECKLDGAQRAGALLAWANAASMAGRREMAFLRYRRALESPGISAVDRAWAYQGLAITFGEDGDAERHADYLRRASDTFLEAGDRANAARSLVGVAKRARAKKPADAVRILREALGLLADAESPTATARRADILRKLAEVHLETGSYDAALTHIQDALQLQRRLLGPDAEQARRGMLHVAIRIELARGKGADVERFNRELLELEQRRPTPGDDLRRRLEAAETMPREDASALLRDIKASSEPQLVMAFHLRRAFAEQDLEQALAELEEARRFLANLKSPRDDDQLSIATAFAVVYEKAGDRERAVEWHRRALELNPFQYASRHAVATHLVENERWAEAVQFFESERARFGDRPGILFFLGRSYLEAGRKDDALGALIAARRLKPTLSTIDELIARAMSEGARPIAPATQEVVGPPVGRADFELALANFARHVSSAQRMTFWERDQTTRKRTHKWRSNPEAHATSLLRSSLAARFDSRIEDFVEAPTGAGRIDVFILLAGGLRLVVELKMCGPGYSTTYARDGLDQLGHYMESKGTSLGYLLIFDARSRDFGQGLMAIETIGKNTLFVSFIDVRPEIPRRRAPGRP